ncbi:hypothetical protein AB0M95_34240 [Sphaerisporangium sp. NPDC051017]|uniref:hypothetical protein n=1 Tax=Sphaerisporangium sp. NPDC051017 TaxID=3154636 RepID=UPI003435C608
MNEQADVTLPYSLDAGDSRRFINAHLHVLHLDNGTLCLHAVALYRDDHGAVLLLGGHGAGKTLVAVAMLMRGWQLLAGDIALLDVEDVALRGGTSAFVVRLGPAHRWFPHLGLPQVVPEEVDLGHRWPALRMAPVQLIAAVSVHVAETGIPPRKIDSHTAQTLWLRASGHLLDRILDDPDIVLRLLENGSAARRRVALIRTLAARLVIHAAVGPPAQIAEQVERLVMRTGAQS